MIDGLVLEYREISSKRYRNESKKGIQEHLVKNLEKTKLISI